MKRIGFTSRIAAVVLLVMSNQAQARLVSVLSYKEMFAKSDLVVIADPVSKTTDAKEESLLPGVSRQDKHGRESSVRGLASKPRSPYQSFSKGTRVSSDSRYITTARRLMNVLSRQACRGIERSRPRRVRPLGHGDAQCLSALSSP